MRLIIENVAYKNNSIECVPICAIMTALFANTKNEMSFIYNGLDMFCVYNCVKNHPKVCKKRLK